MKIDAKPTGQQTVTMATTQYSTTAAQEARERAISKLMGETKLNQEQTTPVQNPTNVTPEELNLVNQSKSEKEESKIVETSGQSPTPDETPVSEKETKPSEEATKPEKEELLSTQYAILARKEKALRARVQAQEEAKRTLENEYKAKEEALKSKEAQYQSNYISKDMIKQNPWLVLQDLGITYDQVAEMALNQPQQDPYAKAEINKLREEIESLKQGIDNTKKGFEEQQTKAYQQALNQIRNEATALVSQDPAFETIKETKSVDKVVELIEETFNKDGMLLTVEQAAQLVEEELMEEVERLIKINKIKQKLSTPAPTPKVESPKLPEPSKQPQQPIKTLTNSVSTSRKLSNRERAIRAALGESLE